MDLRKAVSEKSQGGTPEKQEGRQVSAAVPYDPGMAASPVESSKPPTEGFLEKAERFAPVEAQDQEPSS